VLPWTKGGRDLLRSFGCDIRCSVSEVKQDCASFPLAPIASHPLLGILTIGGMKVRLDRVTVGLVHRIL